jgi:hypothetical protein
MRLKLRQILCRIVVEIGLLAVPLPARQRREKKKADMQDNAVIERGLHKLDLTDFQNAAN